MMFVHLFLKRQNKEVLQFHEERDRKERQLEMKCPLMLRLKVIHIKHNDSFVKSSEHLLSFSSKKIELMENVFFVYEAYMKCNCVTNLNRM